MQKSLTPLRNTPTVRIFSRRRRIASDFILFLSLSKPHAAFQLQNRFRAAPLILFAKGENSNRTEK